MIRAYDFTAECAGIQVIQRSIVAPNPVQALRIGLQLIPQTARVGRITCKPRRIKP